MVICEERAFERILACGFCDTAIPVSIRQENGSLPCITVLPSLKKTAVRFEKQFSDDCFSKAAHQWLRDNIRAFMDSIGFKDNRQSRKISLIMERTGNKRECAVSSDAVLIQSSYGNITGADIDSLLEFGHIVCGVITDGKIVSVAYTDLKPLGKSVEVGIETAVPYRNRGFAKASLSKLTSVLESRGIAPIYICSENNTASLKTAFSCGYSVCAREYNYVFRRK